MDAELASGWMDELTAVRQRLRAALAGTADGPAAAAAAAAGLAAYELARLDGLCNEGAWECALEAARRAQT